MTSQVDTTIPADNVKTDKADFRAQFNTIKNELEALQDATSYARKLAFDWFNL